MLWTKNIFCFDIQNNICAQQVVNLYFYLNSMNNISSYCGLTGARMRASEKDLLVKDIVFSTWSLERLNSCQPQFDSGFKKYARFGYLGTFSLYFLYTLSIRSRQRTTNFVLQSDLNFADLMSQVVEFFDMGLILQNF